MIQEIEMTYEEKVKMYMKLSKRELITMLLENQRLLSMHIPKVQEVEEEVCAIFTLPLGVTAGNCVYCGKPQWEHKYSLFD